MRAGLPRRVRWPVTKQEMPHIILLPEVPFNQQQFLRRVKATVAEKGFCVVVVSEGVRFANGKFVGESGAAKDAFGHAQLGGVAPVIANMVSLSWGIKTIGR